MAYGVRSTVTTHTSGKFKVPLFDRISSWTVFKLQFDSVAKANAWDKEQVKTAFNMGLRDVALTVLEALGGELSYNRLTETSESRYGGSHLEHVSQAQQKDRSQR